MPLALDREVARERPILFSGPMVRAILDGRKTQTRRVVSRGNSTVSGYGVGAALWGKLRLGGTACKDGTPDGKGDAAGLGCGEYLHVAQAGGDGIVHRVRCRTEPGDRLWVRETIERGHSGDSVAYSADGAVHPDANWPWAKHRLPSIFMPRGLSRIALEVSEVRVERVQEISEDDAGAEGVDMSSLPEDASLRMALGSNANAYRLLWDSINGKRPGCAWADNPWVWAITFRRAS